jgi:peptidyl-Asp metalloendopeptidase
MKPHFSRRSKIALPLIVGTSLVLLGVAAAVWAQDGASRGERLGATQTEAWPVRDFIKGRVQLRLNQLDHKVTQLRENWNHILSRQGLPDAMSPAQEDMLASARKSPEVVSVAVMVAQDPAVTEYALTQGADAPPSGDATVQSALTQIVIPINDTQHVTVRRIKAATGEQGTTWRGQVEETGDSALLMWWKDGHLSGVFGYKGHIYTIVDMGGQLHAVVEADPKKLPPDHAPASADRARSPTDAKVQQVNAPASATAALATKGFKPLLDAERRLLEAKQVTIDVMMLYTQRTANRYNRDPKDLSALAIAQANETFRNSGIDNVNLRLVHAQQVDYDESEGEHFDHLYRMVDGTGAFKDVHRLRNEKRADIVGLVLEDPSGCGLSTRVGADAEEAYFVVHHSCAAISISIAHEIGHILGARHDRTIDQSDAPFAYGHGHVNGTKWRDLMSYQKGCDGCPRIPFWSNPRVTYQGQPTGTPMADNARVILEQAERVSRFR